MYNSYDLCMDKCTFLLRKFERKGDKRADMVEDLIERFDKAVYTVCGIYNHTTGEDEARADLFYEHFFCELDSIVKYNFDTYEVFLTTLSNLIDRTEIEIDAF